MFDFGDLSIEDILDEGDNALRKRHSADKTRWDYWQGKHETPFSPEGTSDEYQQLLQDSPLPLVRLGVKTPVQRLKAGGVRLDGAEDVDEEAYRVWEANNLRSRQRIVYTHALVFGHGIVSVWPDPDNPDTPVIRPEDPRNVHIEPDPDDPFNPLWAVKRVDKRKRDSFGTHITLNEAYVYEPDAVWKFVSRAGSQWELEDVFDNPLGRVPFVMFAPEMDADGSTFSMVDPLLPMQRAIDGMRFDLLLAAQFAAYRQRIISGYDPVLRDEDGEPIFRTNPETGEPILDSDGQPIPIVTNPGRVGVERFLVFPGDATNVFDLPESNLTNYVGALEMLVATFASTAQVPPQYLIGDFKNVSGDLMVATEATLRSLISDLQTSFDEGWESVYKLVYIARGDEAPEHVQTVWEDAEPKSLQVIADASSKMIPNGAPLQMFLEMMPGANPQKVNRWMTLSEEERQKVLEMMPAGGSFGPKPPTEAGADEPAE